MQEPKIRNKRQGGGWPGRECIGQLWDWAELKDGSHLVRGRIVAEPNIPMDAEYLDETSNHL